MKAAADEIAAAADTLQRELKGKTGVQKAALLFFRALRRLVLVAKRELSRVSWTEKLASQ